MRQFTTDDNLLFAILAMQMNFVTREQLLAAASIWITDKSRSLEQVLVEQGALTSRQGELILALVVEHVKIHGGDTEQSLASLRSMAVTLREDLDRLKDTDIEASLSRLGPAWGATEQAAQTLNVETRSTEHTRFRILRPHARGGLGEVSVALDHELNREVAVKSIRHRFANETEMRSRFVQEARITGLLEHPSVVPIYGMGQWKDGRPFYAMRFIRGDTLREAVDRFHAHGTTARTTRHERLLGLRRLLGHFVDACHAIEYAHSRGVLHRDLKPGNIMLGKYGETLVVDWGLAKFSTPSAAQMATEELLPGRDLTAGCDWTQFGAAQGTPAFMSPEQASGRTADVGRASDVFNLGATLYYALTGKPPYPALDVGEALRQAQTGDFARPREVRNWIPRSLEAVCLKAMAHQPEDRYDSIRALGADVELWLSDEPVAALRETVHERMYRWAKRHRAWLLAGVSVLFGVTTVSLVAWVSVQRTNSEFRRIAKELENARSQLEQKNALAELFHVAGLTNAAPNMIGD